MQHGRLRLGSSGFQDQVANKVLLTKGALEAAIDNIRGAVMIAFPQGLPEWDLVRQAIEGTEELAGTSVSTCAVIVSQLSSLPLVACDLHCARIHSIWLGDGRVVLLIGLHSLRPHIKRNV